jgi:phenylacetate-coenzyme A ligase PaaK-like adenylate-forming protein
MNLKYIKSLCELENPYATFDDELFVKAMRENIDWHKNHNGFYRKLLSAKRFILDDFKTIDELKDVPYIIATFFKQYELLSISKDEISLHLTSSGTTGQKSQIFFDSWTIGVAQKMVDKIFKYYDWIDDDDEVNYLLYSYEPKKKHGKLGTAYTDNYLCKYTKINSVHYALKEGQDGKYEFDLFGTLEALERFSLEGKPVRIFGFPAFFHFTLELLKEKGGLSKPLNPKSFVFLGGGWKGNQEKAISKLELYKTANKLLGILDDRLRDGFGSVEHCIPYIECKRHNFHIPVWSRVLIRDVQTLEPLPYGSEGYLNLVSPYITSVPANSVLMTDIARTYPGKNCGCELDSPYFEILGRAGTKSSKSCAVSALDLLKGRS